MKTKNMRKKALLSSVAMLLVAVVALSGATYAWFIQSQEATAKSIRLKTESASTLVISTDGTNFSPKVDVNWSAVVRPISSETGASFFEATGGDATGVQEDTPVTGISAVSSTDTPYISESVYVKSSVNALVKLKEIKLPTAQQDLKNALRVAVTIGSGQTAVTKVYAPGNDNPTTGTTNDTVVLKEASTATPITGVTYDDLYDGAKASSLGWTTEGHGYGTCTISKLDSVTIGQISKDTSTELKITIWLEGNDADCDNSMSGQIIGEWATGATVGTGDGMQLVFTSIPA